MSSRSRPGHHRLGERIKLGRVPRRGRVAQPLGRLVHQGRRVPRGPQVHVHLATAARRLGRRRRCQREQRCQRCPPQLEKADHSRSRSARSRVPLRPAVHLTARVSSPTVSPEYPALAFDVKPRQGERDRFHSSSWLATREERRGRRRPVLIRDWITITMTVGLLLSLSLSHRSVTPEASRRRGRRGRPRRHSSPTGLFPVSRLSRARQHAPAHRRTTLNRRSRT